MSITPRQLAAVLQRAANLRPDVCKATIRVAEDDPDMLLVDVWFASAGRRVQREAAAPKLIHPAADQPATCGGILASWLGPMPEDPHAATRQSALIRERDRYLHQTPAQVLAAPPHPPTVTPSAAPAPDSRHDWKQPPPPPELPDGTLPDPIPEAPAEASSPDPGDDPLFYTDQYRERKPKLTRAQMIERGMNEAQRHAQYRMQRGKHPDDLLQ